jgi:Zn-dependent protease
LAPRLADANNHGSGIANLDSAYNFGKLFGIRFRVHYSWFFFFALLTLFLARGVFPGAVKGESIGVYWLMGLITSVLFFFSILLHEMGHCLVGRANGIPVGSITLFLFGGAAQMNREAASAAVEIKMALAGPVTGLMLAGIFDLIYIGFLGSTSTIAAVSLWLAQINLIVAGFNLLPGFPLDGGRVLRGLWWHFSGDYKRATHVAFYCGRVAGIVIIGAGLYILVISGDWLSGIWLAVIGGYLESSARLSIKQFSLQQWMKGKKVADVVQHNCTTIDHGVSVVNAKRQYPRQRCFLMDLPEKGKVVAFLTSGDNTPESTPLAELAQPLDQAIEVKPEDDLLGLAQQMNEAGKDFAVVKEGDNMVGLVFLDSMIELVNVSIAPPEKS